MFKITHFSRRSSEKSCWVAIGFITVDQHGVFRFGIDDLRHFTQEDIQSSVSRGPLIELREPVPFDPNQDKLVWLQGPDYKAKVWLANRHSAMTDTEKILLWEGSLFDRVS